MGEGSSGAARRAVGAEHPPGEPALQLIGAGFRYYGTDSDGASEADDSVVPGAPRVAALADIDLRVRRGETVAVLGRQGSGTSTICRLAAGLLADRGDATGHVLRSNAAGGVAMLGEDPEAQLTGMTSFVDDEVRLPTRLHGGTGTVDAAAALARLGMGRLLGRRLDTLSGGERQLVALAGLMTLRPALLVLDQPALSLDPEARRLLRRALHEFCADGGAVLLSGHQFDDLAAAADRITLLQDGRIVRVLSPAAATEGVLAEYGVWSAVDGSTESISAASEDRTVRAETGERNELSEPDERAGAVPSAAPEQARSTARESGQEHEHALLRVRGLGIDRGGARIIDGIDIDVAAGRVLAVVGANGAGKSTLLRGLAGLLDSVGRIEVRLGGGPLSEKDPRGGSPDPERGSAGGAASRAGSVLSLQGEPVHRRAHRIAWVGQDPGSQLSAASVRSELEKSIPHPRRRDRARSRAERAARTAEALELVGLVGREAAHPYDLTPGQRRDLVIASALLLRPDVLLLDEPTLGRDLAGMDRLDRVIRSFAAAGGAVIVTTHELRWAAATADSVLRLGA